MDNNGFWLSILEYAQYRDISISTIRRYIKAERIKYKLDNGKYFIFVNSDNYEMRSDASSKKLEEDNCKLKRQLQITLEEIEDLKILVSVYEKRNIVRTSLPPLPE